MRKTTMWALALALTLAACGGDESGVTTTMTDGSTAMNDVMSDMNMGDPGATPAAEVPGADVVTGSFGLLDTAPSGHEEVTGTAWLARHQGGTTVSISVEGLVPGTSYMSHVHEGACAEAGGEHYRFDPEGSELPPNEIHLAFTADGAGRATMTVENGMVASDDARSVVVHPADLMDNKVACADF
jgi:hypothetical protein